MNHMIWYISARDLKQVCGIWYAPYRCHFYSGHVTTLFKSLDRNTLSVFNLYSVRKMLLTLRRIPWPFKKWIPFPPFELTKIMREHFILWFELQLKKYKFIDSRSYYLALFSSISKSSSQTNIFIFLCNPIPS